MLQLYVGVKTLLKTAPNSQKAKLICTHHSPRPPSLSRNKSQRLTGQLHLRIKYRTLEPTCGPFAASIHMVNIHTATAQAQAHALGFSARDLHGRFCLQRKHDTSIRDHSHVPEWFNYKHTLLDARARLPANSEPRDKPTKTYKLRKIMCRLDVTKLTQHFFEH